MPLVSVLYDTMNDQDPRNDRARYIWAYGYNKPSLWQRFSAAVPFIYRRAGRDHPPKNVPAPLLDMAAPAKGTWQKVAGAAAQSLFLTPSGCVPGRRPAPTGLEPASTGPCACSARSRCSTRCRKRVAWLLRNCPRSRGVWRFQPLFWRIGQQQLHGASVERRRHNSGVDRGHNWELLRQRAEENGLYFQPLRLGSDEANFALLWVEQSAAERPFDGKFLNIADPYRDSRIQQWRGYAEDWSFDEWDSPVSDQAGVRTARMIPLALYALDHPRVPLLLVDFRDPGKMKRRETAWRVTDDLTTGVLGFTGWGHWPYMLASRHGSLCTDAGGHPSTGMRA